MATIPSGYRWTYGDGFQLCLWYALLAAMIYFFGIIVGTIVYVIFVEAVSNLLFNWFGLEAMTGGDCIFFVDDYRSSTNIIAFHKYKKIEDFEAFREAALRRAAKFSRMRS